MKSQQMKVVSEFRKNSRVHLSDIARKMGIPKTTLYGHYREAKKCIRQCTTLIDFAKLGYSLRINFIFRIKNNKIINNFLLKQANVNSVYKVNNKNTVCIECYFRSMAEAYAFKEKLEGRGIKRIDIRYIIEEHKKEGFLR